MAPRRPSALESTVGFLSKSFFRLQIYRFGKSTWEDELGISLRSRHFPAEIDNTLLKAVLYQNEEEARHWGLKNDASFFRSILLSISDESFLRRRQRSPKWTSKPVGADESFSKQDISEILVELSEKAHIIGPGHRYGHAACEVTFPGNGFVIFGGKMANGSLTNDLWFFNASAIDTDGHWRLRATNSTLQPPKMTRHTITRVGDYLYVFGGGLTNGEFSSRYSQLPPPPSSPTEKSIQHRSLHTIRSFVEFFASN